MYKKMMVVTFLLASPASLGEDKIKQDVADSVTGDMRKLVVMPDASREFMRQQMLTNLMALNEIIGYLAENNLDAAAEVAETQMGRSTMGKYQGTGMGPSRYMPIGMRNIAFGMHDAATEFSNVAKQGDVKHAYAALQKVSNSCVACHYSYRTR